jgi:hypothetical protein
MPWVFLYADTEPRVLEEVLTRAPLCSVPASLPKFRITFRGKSRKWGGAVATVEKDRKSWVYGSAHFVTPDEIKLLDKHYSYYEKTVLPVFIDITQDKIKAHSYILKPDSLAGNPSEEYTKMMLKHLKFFWGQEKGGKMTLDNFGISTDPPLEKKRRKSKEDEEKPPAKVAVPAAESEEETSAEKPKKRRRRRTLKKK